MADDTPRVDADALLDFLLKLGQAYLASGEQTALAEDFLRQAANAYGFPRTQVVAFPTAIYIGLYDGTREHVRLVEGPTDSLRLDQIAEVYALGEAAQAGGVTPSAGLDQLAQILRKPARFGPAGIVVGHSVLTLGLAMLLSPSLENLIAAGILGLIVGSLKVFNQGRPVLALPLPVSAAAMVSALVFLAVKWGLPVYPQHALLPPLVTFLSGAMLSLGMVELAYGDMVSGVSRLITGFVKLLLLAFGLVAGAVLVGYRPDDLIDPGPEILPPAWMAWAGVIVFGLGAHVHFSAPRRSLGWMLLVLLVAFAAQRLATPTFGKELSGFFGTLLATPLGYLIQKRFKGPPAMVTFLPSFWLLVPGALGLLSIKQMLTDRVAGIEGLTTAIFAFASIGLGTLVGASLYRTLTRAAHRWRRFASA